MADKDYESLSKRELIERLESSDRISKMLGTILLLAYVAFAVYTFRGEIIKVLSRWPVDA